MLLIIALLISLSLQSYAKGNDSNEDDLINKIDSELESIESKLKSFEMSKTNKKDCSSPSEDTNVLFEEKEVLERKKQFYFKIKDSLEKVKTLTGGKFGKTSTLLEDSYMEEKIANIIFNAKEALNDIAELFEEGKKGTSEEIMKNLMNLEKSYDQTVKNNMEVSGPNTHMTCNPFKPSGYSIGLFLNSIVQKNQIKELFGKSGDLRKSPSSKDSED
ncbi:hypothetical protein TUBRATIS_007220 [Tubulinosema ratisbonensis]|uniref:Uncharacterized protein n=1 Tax=Tubulinosema ratisbonensis TaxID=291195 RepID=A0A437ANW5_9MICR|nr:hypothetical protein TUBRATIS_007220 [Tubulinosema ratisbonensis]